MIKHLLKGILRDNSRSFLPIVIISIGVFLTVVLSGFMRGMLGDMVDSSARYQTGHLKVMTKAFNKEKDQMPIDLALLDVDELKEKMEKDYPEITWVNRINFGGLADVPDENGETKGQGPISGMAVELFNKESGEIERMNIKKSLVTGRIPNKSGEVIVSDNFAKKMNIKIGDDITYFGTTVNSSMTFKNFKISGTIQFGNTILDKGAVIIDISDAQEMLDLTGGTTEILGFQEDNVYNDEAAEEIANKFNAKYSEDTDEFAPIMLRLRDQNNLSTFLDYVDIVSSALISIFIFAMSIVLWNTGLLGGLRRFKEFGIRLALGERKGHIYRTIIYEALFIGIIGSIVGTILGLIAVSFLETNGLDLSGSLKNASMMMPSVVRAKFSVDLMYIGFIPGVIAMVIGSALSGIAIYRRSTASLFKELEV